MHILELYRENDDPELRMLNGKSLETFSRDKNLRVERQRNQQA